MNNSVDLKKIYLQVFLQQQTECVVCEPGGLCDWRRIRNELSKLAADGGCDINWRRENEVLLSCRGRTLADKWLQFLSSTSASASCCLCVTSRAAAGHCTALHTLSARVHLHLQHEPISASVCVCVCVCSIHLSEWHTASVSSCLPFTRHWLSPWDRELFSQLAQSETGAKGPAV